MFRFSKTRSLLPAGTEIPTPSKTRKEPFLTVILVWVLPSAIAFWMPAMLALIIDLPLRSMVTLLELMVMVVPAAV
jgi:hypothetical protein